MIVTWISTEFVICQFSLQAYF